MKQRLFVDMDGTLAEFHPVHSMEELHAKGYFAGLPPQQNVVEAVRILNADLQYRIPMDVWIEKVDACTMKKWEDMYC